MIATAPAAEARPSSLDSPALSRRLAQLVGDERAVQVAFLLHLEEYDRRRAWAEAGYPSLWEWCLRVLHLREGAAYRRIAAMRVLRRFPKLAEPLRDGRLCLSTLPLLGPVLTEENVTDVTGRAAYLNKAEVERLVAALAPRTAPRESIRKIPARPDAASSPAEETAALPSPLLPVDRHATEDALLLIAPRSASAPEPMTIVAHVPPAPSSVTAPARPERLAAPAHPRLRPVDAEAYSLKVTVDAAFKAELETLRALLAHKLPTGELGAVLREAVRCAIEKHGRRKGAVDHIRPAALGGPSTAENLRLACATHNRLHAEHSYGRAFMDRVRARAGARDGCTSPGGSGAARG